MALEEVEHTACRAMIRSCLPLRLLIAVITLFSFPSAPVQSSIYDNLGGRIKFVRNRGTHGQWSDVSAEGVFYATLTAILYLASP
jgi:hypothetical protein